MNLARTSWRRYLAKSLLALVLILSHSSLMPDSLVQRTAPALHADMAMAGGDCHAAVPDHPSVPANPCGKACPGMALLLPEPSPIPVRLSFDAYPPVPTLHAEGTSPGLDTPPPRTVAPV
ncbi:MAG: hypothetical protein HQL43_09530 [Alphaproteobacteria bacterium]|nr:hypothetical protein [Alphaproteobacteria bacterium]